MSSYQNWYQSQTYPAWDIPLARDASATGTSTTTVAPGSVTITTSAGFLANVTTSTPVVVDSGTNQEIVTPTSVNVATNQFTATFTKSHSGTYALSANQEDLTNVLMNTFTMTFRNGQGADTLGTGTFSLKTATPAEIYYKPSPADVASVFSGTIIVECNFPPSNGPADHVIYDPLPFSITAS